ncbi:hypothetical protein ACIQUL_34560 [Streptomyces sp. NPDC090303]|uniref:hypothetical protein n=1 Tax=Streptomyces sp. NPDC090303 TaxID=3365960 RepID=UPI0038089190
MVTVVTRLAESWPPPGTVPVAPTKMHHQAAPGPVERGINRLESRRVVATRYDKLALRNEAMVLVAAIDEWI